jgi:hypothetical protein
MARLLREPLLHFCLLGGLIFGADAVLHPPAKDNKEIVITRGLRQSFINGFDEDKQRTPTEAQLQQMFDNYIASEILYREGKALGVDRGDEMIRERITYKLQELIFEQIKVPRPTDDQLREWFESNRKQFDEPERLGFYLTLPSDEASARQTLDDIRARHENPDVQKKTRAFVGRPVESLAASFGDGFKAALLALPLQEWSVIQSKEGWHVIRLDSRLPGATANFDDFRDAVTKIWMTNETSKRAREAVARLKSNYRVRYEQ